MVTAAGYAEEVSRRQGEGSILVLDTCGECASLAVAREDGSLVAERHLEARAASASLPGAVRILLAETGTSLAALAGVGVVHGPGSFTGVRVGLAFAKGLCESADLPLAAVSRLQVLAEAGNEATIAAVGAGRDQVYARFQGAQGASEQLMHEKILFSLHPNASFVVDSEQLAGRLRSMSDVRWVDVRWVELTAAHAIAPVLKLLAQGGSPLATLDANYVRNEDTIYGSARTAVQSDANREGTGNT